jgi:hypothetical protein
LDSGRSNEDLLLTLKELFAIYHSGFNDLIKRELKIMNEKYDHSCTNITREHAPLEKKT